MNEKINDAFVCISLHYRMQASYWRYPISLLLDVYPGQTFIHLVSVTQHTIPL